MFRQIFVFSLILIGFTACKTNHTYLADASIDYLRAEPRTDSLGDNPEIESLIGPYKEEMSKQMDLPLGELPEDLVKDRPNSNLGNWFCDILLDMAEVYYPGKVDFAVQNYGGLRLPFLGKGEITKSDIYQLMPFDNFLVVVDMDSKVLKRFIDDMADSGGWPLSRGIEFRIDGDRGEDIKIGGMPLDDTKTYKVAMPDYIANGWGGQEYLGDCKQFSSNVFIRDAVIDHLYTLLEENKKISIDSSKRIH